MQRGEKARAISRRELFRAAGGAFTLAYFFAMLLAATGALWVVHPGPETLPLLVLAALQLTAALGVKGSLLRDLREGRTETVRVRIAYWQNAGSLRACRVLYLVEAGASSRKFVLFPDAAVLPPGWNACGPAGPAVLRVLPRSRVVVGVETAPEPEDPPKHRTPAWYVRREISSALPRPCGLREDYWLREMMSVGILLLALAAWELTRA